MAALAAAAEMKAVATAGSKAKAEGGAEARAEARAAASPTLAAVPLKGSCVVPPRAVWRVLAP